MTSPDVGTQLIVGAPATLIVRQPPDRVRTFTLTHEALSIGRHPTNQMVIDVPTVSAEHALIE